MGYQKVLVKAFWGSFFATVFDIWVDNTLTPETALETPNITPQYNINWFWIFSLSILPLVHKSSAPYKYDNSWAIFKAIPKNCKISAGIVAAITNPPVIPVIKDAIDDWLVLVNISFLAKRLISSLLIPASTGPFSSISSKLSVLLANCSIKNCFLLTLTPGSWTAFVITSSSIIDWAKFFSSIYFSPIIYYSTI